MKRKSSSRKSRAQQRLLKYGSYLAGASLLMAPTFGADAVVPEAAAEKKPTSRDSRVDIMEIPLEELMKIKVTSSAKKVENLSDAATAIYVITNEDIRRSGVTSIPEALRLSPGIEVARQDSHTWAISSRGFNDEFANQLLVLIDGRSVYTPLFAGVYWDVQDLMLEDVDRIEVIRGPGGSLWGANAVNGVINITTRSAEQTQGVLVTGGAGTEELGFGVRYGGKHGENTFYRVYGKWFDRDDSVTLNGQEPYDAWNMQRGGFRIDHHRGEQNTFTLQGDIYSGRLEQNVTVPLLTPPYTMQDMSDVEVSGANVLGRSVHEFSDTSDLALKIYFDHTQRDRVVFAERRNTFDIDLQHHFQLGSRMDFVVGAGYNLTDDDLENRFAVSFNPTERTTHLFNVFAQDEITLIPDRLRLTLGTKVEHNDYTGWELQPSARLTLNITDKQTAWFAASRAISTPSRAEHNIRINREVIPPAFLGLPGDPAGLVSQYGSESMVSKELIGFELGYRVQLHKRVTTDIASFFNLYDRLRSLEPGPFFPENGHITFPVTIGNRLEGETYGFEVATTVQATDWWRIRANYSFLKIQLRKEVGSGDPILEGAEKDSPRHQVGIRSLMDLPHDIELDTGMRFVDSLDNRGVDRYVVGDIRVGWRPNRHWEFSVTGQNLFGKHQEFAPFYIQTQATKVEASVFGKITYRY